MKKKNLSFLKVVMWGGAAWELTRTGDWYLLWNLLERQLWQLGSLLVDNHISRTWD